MSKILLAIDPVGPDKDALDFASFIVRLTGSKITAVVLENVLAGEQQYGTVSFNDASRSVTEKDNIIEKSIGRIKEACLQRDVNYRLHRDRGVPLSELINESRFADMLVINRDISLSKYYEGSLSGLAKNILKKSECPVIIAPQSFDGIDTIVFAYDGSASSVYAMKLFTYLFPQLRNRKVKVLQVNKDGVLKDRHKYIFTEWLKEHYADIHFEVLAGDAEKGLLAALLNYQNVFLVMGAYGKHTVSIFPLKSKAEIVVKILNHPVFIAHQ